MADVDLDKRAIESLRNHPDVKIALDKIGRKIAEQAAINAPKDTTFGATSIQHEVDEDERGARVRISWAKAAFYMQFHELGTSEMRARPFLRPALDRRYTL